MKTAEHTATASAVTSSQAPFFSRQGNSMIPTEQGHFFPRTQLPVQTKLNIGQPNDIYEQEADAMADKVVQRLAAPAKPSAPLIQEKCTSCEEEEKKKLQAKSEVSSPETASESIENNLSSSKGSGSQLPADVRDEMQSSFGADFSNVRVHNGSDAVEMSNDLHALLGGVILFQFRR
jgi:hypothetical protein